MPRLLEVDNVSKSFGGVAANVDISFDVREGEILGLIGPNGAGKTSLFNVHIRRGGARRGRGTARRKPRLRTAAGAVSAARYRPHLPGRAQLRFHDGAGERHGRRLCPAVAHASRDGARAGDAGVHRSCRPCRHPRAFAHAGREAAAGSSPRTGHRAAPAAARRDADRPHASRGAVRRAADPRRACTRHNGDDGGARHGSAAAVGRIAPWCWISAAC